MGRWLVVALAGLALALAAPAAGVNGGGGDEQAELDARIAALDQQIAASKGQEGVLTSQLSSLTDELQSAQSAVDEAQSSLDGLEAQLTSERAELDRLTEQLRTQTTRLLRLQAEYRRAVRVLEQRILLIYEQQPPDVLSYLVSASSFSDLIDNMEFLNRVGLQDKRIAREVGEAKAEASAERKATAQTRKQTADTVATIAARTDEARSVRDKLVASRDSLTSAQQLKASALADVHETQQSYLVEVQGLEAQSAALGAQIQSAQSSSTASPSASGLIWPVSGPVTSGFGMRWGRMHTGIDIAVPSGTPVHAAASGTIVYASWMSGYGYLVAIDHGGGIATAYAHNSSLLVHVGQQVSQGDTISLSGSTGHSTGPHVHFEVRVNGVPVDPLSYL